MDKAIEDWLIDLQKETGWSRNEIKTLQRNQKLKVGVIPAPREIKKLEEFLKQEKQDANLDK